MNEPLIYDITKGNDLNSFYKDIIDGNATNIKNNSQKAENLIVPVVPMEYVLYNITVTNTSIRYSYHSCDSLSTHIDNCIQFSVSVEKNRTVSNDIKQFLETNKERYNDAVFKKSKKNTEYALVTLNFKNGAILKYAKNKNNDDCTIKIVPANVDIKDNIESQEYLADQVNFEIINLMNNQKAKLYSEFTNGFNILKKTGSNSSNAQTTQTTLVKSIFTEKAMELLNQLSQNSEKIWIVENVNFEKQALRGGTNKESGLSWDAAVNVYQAQATDLINNDKEAIHFDSGFSNKSMFDEDKKYILFLYEYGDNSPGFLNDDYPIFELLGDRVTCTNIYEMKNSKYKNEFAEFNVSLDEFKNMVSNK
jgi:hypothetical protein